MFSKRDSDSVKMPEPGKNDMDLTKFLSSIRNQRGRFFLTDPVLKAQYDMVDMGIELPKKIGN